MTGKSMASKKRKWKPVSKMDTKERREYAELCRIEFAKAVRQYGARHGHSPYTGLGRLRRAKRS